MIPNRAASSTTPSGRAAAMAGRLRPGHPRPAAAPVLGVRTAGAAHANANEPVDGCHARSPVPAGKMSGPGPGTTINASTVEPTNTRIRHAVTASNAIQLRNGSRCSKGGGRGIRCHARCTQRKISVGMNFFQCFAFHGCESKGVVWLSSGGSRRSLMMSRHSTSSIS
jgi:hypothetical protein